MSPLASAPTPQFELNPSAPEFFPEISASQGKTTLALFEAIPHTPHANAEHERFIRHRAQTDSQLIVKDRPKNLKRASTERRRQTAAGGSDAAVAPVATLVIKNLTLQLTTEELLGFLDSKGAVVPQEVEFHLDSQGQFRGTAFVRYNTHEDAKTSLEALGSSPELAGRKARVEFQKAKGRDGRSSLEAELPTDEIGVVQETIEKFLGDPTQVEQKLPATFNVQQRKYAHSLAERHNLVHITKQGEAEGEKYVYLSKQRADKAGSTSVRASRARTVSFSSEVSGSPLFCPSELSQSPGLSPGLSPHSSPWYSPVAAPLGSPMLSHTLGDLGIFPNNGDLKGGPALFTLSDSATSASSPLDDPQKVELSPQAISMLTPTGPNADGSVGFTRPRSLTCPWDPIFVNRGSPEGPRMSGAPAAPPGLENEA
jgi:hypothetical protein